MSDTSAPPPENEHVEKGAAPELEAGAAAAPGEHATSAEDKKGAAPDGSAPDLAEELRSANDRLLRAQAELENYRKRARREMEDQRRYAALPLIRDPHYPGW